MTPLGICACLQETDDCCSIASRFVGLLQPAADFAAIEWIHKDHMIGPALEKTVLGRA
jgi:hypothetical protein